MKTKTYTFEVITPCFCAGAEQTKAEIRASSIRGALRWWFRALGGSAEQEAEVFGGIRPGENRKSKARASSVRIRVGNVSEKRLSSLPRVQGVDPLSYILYFPSVASNGSRWNPNACVAPETTFSLEILFLGKIDSESSRIFLDALLAFRHFGAIGMHVTRGLGALQDRAIDENSWKSAIALLEKHGFVVREGSRSRLHQDWKSAMKEAGRWLQLDLRKQYGAGGNKKPPKASALGSTPVSSGKCRSMGWTNVPRQTSAVYLRFRKLPDGRLQFLAFEAPHDRVLGAVSRVVHNEPILASRDFTNPPPSN